MWVSCNINIICVILHITYPEIVNYDPFLLNLTANVAEFDVLAINKSHNGDWENKTHIMWIDGIGGSLHKWIILQTIQNVY